jgi:hypothetical protein
MVQLCDNSLRLMHVLDFPGIGPDADFFQSLPFNPLNFRPFFLVCLLLKFATAAEFADPLIGLQGGAVKTAEEWKATRVPELRKLFQEEMYGMMPEKPGSMEVKVLHEDKAWLGGKATLKELEVHFSKPETTAHLLLVVPNQRQGPVATFLGMNFKGNHALLADEGIAIPAGMLDKDAARATDKGWPIEAMLGRGYGFACFYSGDFVRDQAEIALARVKEFSAPEGTAAESAPATLACWAWGFSRMVDVLEKQPEVDVKRIAAVGHSRNGKACLFAAAMDERIALAIPTQAGCGGTAPSKLPEQPLDPKSGRPAHETVEIITTKFPHWFCGKFNAVGKNTERLKFDQHELVALCAPRPVLFSCAVGDVWSNPEGQFAMLLAADPVYQLVAAEGIGAKQMPEVGKLMPSRLGYFIRPGGHSMNEDDWMAWLDYADIWLKAKR